ncbi:MAG: glucose-6-phosphate dehydrogenase assembly protein OpcA [Acidobacteriota bacterium]|nr:glucose-6-phosphate dehydrogenase assembly protein OpcA [Acidobacteriota bacterium]
MEKTVSPASPTIQPETILHELSDLWVSLAKQPAEGEAAGVLRACAMTLITVVDETEDPAAVSETLAELMHEHPSRAIVIRLRATSEPVLSARVLAQCWMPFGKGRQICCEQIEITASDASLPDLAGVVLPLTVPDLPVILWCRSPRLFRLPGFPRIAEIAQKVIVDSAAFPESAPMIREIAEFLKEGRLIADLAWTRLTRWRELVAQIFENRSYLAELAHIRRLRVSSERSSGTYYLAAWLLDSLEKAGCAPTLVWDQPGPAAVAFESDDRWRVSIQAEEGSNVEVRVNDLITHAVFAPPSDYTLLREELSIPGRDPVFEAALRRAVGLL